ncbi:calcium-binding protein [Sphaerotilus sulfidivorans]
MAAAIHTKNFRDVNFGIGNFPDFREKSGSKGWMMATRTGTAGNDSLVGTTGADIFDGLGGNDTLVGGAGDDIYYFGRGGGKDIIASSYDSRATRSEKLVFKAGVLPTDIQASFVGADLVLAIKGTSDSITIQDFKFGDTPANVWNPVQQVSFTGSTTVWNTTQMITEALRGTAGADSLVGTSLNDTFSGSAGNDTMVGGAGDDTYYFGRGEGKDIISSSNYDPRATRSEKLVFKAGVLPTDIQASFVGKDLVLAIKGTSDSITIQDFKFGDTPANVWNPVQQVSFTGSTTVWNTTQMITEALRGTAGADSLVGTSLNDTFSGSAGNDTMVGGAGDDTYYFGRGEGKDIISSSNYDPRATRSEKLVFKAGVLPTDIQASFVGKDLVLAIKGTSDSITIQDFKFGDTPANVWNPVQQVSFTGSTTVWNTTQMVTEALRGTTGADSLVGTDLNDIFSGSAGNDTMLGNRGDDTYYFGRGEGKDLISQDYDTRATRAETLIFKSGVLPTDIQASLSGNNLVLAIKGTTDSVTIQNFKDSVWNPIQQVRFANGTTWNLATLRSKVGLSTTASGASAAMSTQIDQLVSAMATMAPGGLAASAMQLRPSAETSPLLLAAST